MGLLFGLSNIIKSALARVFFIMFFCRGYSMDKEQSIVEYVYMETFTYPQECIVITSYVKDATLDHLAHNDTIVVNLDYEVV